MHFALILIPLVTVFIGSHLSLYHESEEEEEDYLTLKEATMFPIIASVTLFSLYIALRYFPNFVDYFMTGYIFLLGIASLFFVISHTLRLQPEKLKLKLEYEDIVLVNLKFGFGEVISLMLSVGILALYFTTKNWILSNLIAFSFCILSIRTIKLDTVMTGVVLLGALFFYDIFWVFQTPVMVTVAKSLDFPIKLLFPRMFIFSVDLIIDTKDFAMLGLGDIVIPGFFSAVCLRYDLHHKLGKLYFYTSLGFYTIGLSFAILMSELFQNAQPALLYISPACIFSVLLLAVYRGEFFHFVKFKVKNTSKSSQNLVRTLRSGTKF
jgi:minor histocompatibility antigen H13